MPAKSHGKSGTPLYRIWKGMKNRCYNPKFKQWKDYGGRGIEVCVEWRNSFPAFINAVGHRPTRKHVLDREDNDVGYFPGNVRWVDRTTSNLNRRSRRIVAGLPMAAAARKAGLTPGALKLRLNSGMNEQEALQLPMYFRLRKGKAR